MVDNGIDLTGYDIATGRPAPPGLVSLPTLRHPGLHTVVDAFIQLVQDEAFADWRLAIGGSCTDADDKYLQQKRQTGAGRVG